MRLVRALGQALVALVCGGVCVGALAAPAAAQGGRADGGRETLEWREQWGRFGLGHGITLGVTLTTAFGVRFAHRPESPRWSRPILFDASIHDRISVSDAGRLERIALASDVLLISSALSTLLDATLVAGVRRDSPDAVGQMLGMNALSYSLTALLVATTKVGFARERPFATRRGCADDPEAPGCGTTSRNMSFISGHSAMAFTGAALTCVQHRHMPLHESRAVGGTRCALSLGIATTTALLRVTADKHWTTDVIFGAAVGFLSGWLLPRLLYFRSRGQAVTTVSLPLPYVAPNQGGLSYSGIF
jgi:membrane-associated phospholipid phosphatase